MTRDETERLKALEREATPRPWMALLRGPGVLAAPMVYAAEGKSPAIAVVHGGNADAALISAIRNALPRLLEERERLLSAMKYAFDGDTGFNHDVSEVAYAAIRFAEAASK